MRRPCHRHLPHFHRPGLIQSVTFRLVDSVPGDVLRGWEAELGTRRSRREDPRVIAALQGRIERYADAGHGACWLARPQVARAVVETLQERCGDTHDLIAWCIMPNHVHVLVEPKVAIVLHGLVRGWKTHSARIANGLLGRQGAFWMRDYHDRYIRDESHLERAIRYIEENPVKAGLVRHAGDWEHSSARRPENEG